MKSMHALLAVLIATLVTAALTSAAPGEGVTEDSHQIHLMTIGEGAESLEMDLSDLEEGETRQFFTESGKEVIATRDGDGIHLEIDGKTIDLLGKHGMSVHGSAHGEHDVRIHRGDAKVIIKQLGEDDAHFTFIHEDMDNIEIDGDHHWISDGGAKVVMLGQHKTPAEALIESGVLDQVDESVREEILEVLRRNEARHIKRRIVFEEKSVEGEGEEEGEEG